MARSPKNSDVVHIFVPQLTTEVLGTRLPLTLDMPGLLFLEARKRVERGTKNFNKLRAKLEAHQQRVLRTAAVEAIESADDAWTEVIEEVGSLEPLFGATINEFAIADVLLVAAAEAYINSIAAHVLTTTEAENFDKLSPTAKWLFLPKLMNLKWKPDLAKGCLQTFGTVVARRNRIVHPKPLNVPSAASVDQFLSKLKLDPNSAQAGVKAVSELIRQISASWRGSCGPDWLDIDKALKRKPCFILGPVDAPARLGRKYSGRRRSGH